MVINWCKKAAFVGGSATPLIKYPQMQYPRGPTKLTQNSHKSKTEKSANI